MPKVLSVEYHCLWFYMLLLIYFQHLRKLCMQGMESSVLHSQIKTWVAPQKIKFKLRIKLNHNIYNMWASEPARQVRYARGQHARHTRLMKKACKSMNKTCKAWTRYIWWRVLFMGLKSGWNRWVWRSGTYRGKTTATNWWSQTDLEKTWMTKIMNTRF